MDFMTILTIVGTVISIGSAILAVWQAKESKNAAKESKRVRSELIDHRKTSELAQIQSTCKRAQKSMEKYGYGSAPSSLIGTSPGKDAQDVQELVLILLENRAYFGNKTPNGADEFCEKITPLLNNFAQSQDASTREHGAEILLMIGNLASIIKKLVEDRREGIH